MPPRNQIEQLGLPSGFKVYSPNPFGSLNQSDSRSFIGDSELYWRENYIRVGNGALRAMFDKGDAVYTAPTGKSIISFFSFEIGQTKDTIAVFLSDGTADQVNLATTPPTVTHIATVPTFWAGPTFALPACSQYGSQYLLISNNFHVDNYWVWDGTNLFQAGTIGPQITVTNSGTDYTSAPNVFVHGGSATTAPTFSVDVENGGVANIKVTNPGAGYKVTDFITLVIQGGGSDNQAFADIGITPSSGGIESVAVLDGGTGYSAGAKVVVTGGGGSGASLALQAINGSITQIVVINPGTMFTSPPTITIDDSNATHPGSGFNGVANISFGQVTAVVVTDGGTGYTTPPKAVVLGDGVGATLQAVIDSSGHVSAINIINRGHSYTNGIIQITGGNDGANATVQLMPFGVSGSGIETYQSRVWLTYPNANAITDNGGTMLLSAPESLTDFATSDGGLLFVNNDRFLRTQFTAIRQTNGYLYPFGDSSVSVISNVQTAGNPTTTTFNFQNTDPQIGTSWRDSLQDFSRTILFGNQLGVYGLYGGSVTKVSQKIDNLFTSAPKLGVVPSAAVANVFSQRMYLLLRTIYDPIQQINRTVMLGWDEKEWMVLSQSVNLTYIGTREVNSDLSAWGTDGTTLFPLFSRASTGLVKTLSSKLYGAQNIFVTKESLIFYLMARVQSIPAAGSIAFTALIENESTGYPIPVEPAFPAALVNGTSTNVFYSRTGDVMGQLLGFTLTSTSPDFSIENAIMGYQDITAIY